MSRISSLDPWEATTPRDGTTATPNNSPKLGQTDLPWYQVSNHIPTSWERRWEAPGGLKGMCVIFPLELPMQCYTPVFGRPENHFNHWTICSWLQVSELLPRSSVLRHIHCQTLRSNFEEWVTKSPVPFLEASLGSQHFNDFQFESMVCVPLILDNPLGTLRIVEAYSLCWWFTWKQGTFKTFAALDHARAPSA